MRLISLPGEFGELLINIDRINYLEGTHNHTFIHMASMDEMDAKVVLLPLHETAQLITSFHKESSYE